MLPFRLLTRHDRKILPVGHYKTMVWFYIATDSKLVHVSVWIYIPGLDFSQCAVEKVASYTDGISKIIIG